MIGEIRARRSLEQAVEMATDPLPLAKEQKSAEVIENKEERLGKVQKSEGMCNGSEGGIALGTG